MTATGLEATEVFEIEKLSSSEKYKREWNDLKKKLLSNNLEGLRQLAFDGDLKVSKFRSICWSLLLRVINDKPEDWSNQRNQQRERYYKLKEEFAKNPHNLNDLNDDPLSQSQKSVWNQYFGDQELFSVIKQDVVRTFPGVDFFRKQMIQDTMTNILFNYAREHPYMSYRQGMHEILAPILFVMHSDHQALLHFQEVSREIDQVLLDVLDPQHLESDSYFIFSRIMSSIESYYRIVNMMPTAGGYFPPQTELPQSPVDGASITEIEVIGQLNYIRDKILAKTDLHLHNHLQKLEIPLHLFGIRWLRLLFGREFALLDLLMLWDAIFADSDSFDLPNYILVAMLIRIRDKLLLSDYTTCLTFLMRYPTNIDVGLILRYALHMKMPQKYDFPPDAFVYVTAKPEGQKSKTEGKVQSATLPRQQSFKGASAIPKHLNSVSTDANIRARSSSLNSNALTSDQQIEAKLKELQLSTSAYASRLASTSKINDNDLPIMDGYCDDSPELLRMELQHAQKILFVSRLQLKKYLNTLRRHITRTHSDDLNQTLDGIEELCSFLDVQFSVPNPLRERVDPALEADENQTKRSPVDKQTDLSETKKIQTKRNITESEAKKEFVKNLEISKSPPFEIKVTDDGQPIKMNENHRNETTATVINSGTRYEIPDNGFMENSSKVLGTKKEVELTVFRHKNLDTHEGVPSADPIGVRDN